MKQFPVEQDNKTQSITRSQKTGCESYSSTKKQKIKKKLKKLKKEKAQTFILQNI